MSMLVALGIEPLVMVFQPSLLGWALFQALVACLAFGLLPALAITGNDLAQAARRDSALFNGRIQASKLRGVLMSAQVAVSLVLLITSALIIDATRRADSVEIGYPVQQIIDLRHPSADADLRRHIGQVPGVLNTTAVANAPLYGSTFRTPMRVDGRAEQLALHRVDERYFDVLSIPPLLGRSFRHDEAEHGANVAVISQATARLLWPDASPLGRSIHVLDANGEGTPRRVEVIGVVRDVVSGMLMQGVDRSAVYLPGALGQDGVSELVVRVDPSRIDATRRALAAACLDHGSRQPCTPWTLAEMTRVYRLPLVVASTLAASLGAIALLISAAGLFGVVRFQVAARTREIGVRMALGANSKNVLWLVLRQALHHIRSGVVLGMLASLALSGVLASQIGLARAFPVIGYAGVPLLLLAVTLVATALPALRATRIEATEALREG
ncbi:MAG: ABC transporter permease [Ahniella sp.]|nr:ABC transporter permease [Ahniella sp.]